MENARHAEQQEIHRLADLSPVQWRSGIAAWLGWMFDGLDMHLYTLVALPFAAQLPGRTTGAGFCYNIGRIAAAAGTVFLDCSAR